ncbi:uncharacterized protein BYT42DRAFT_341036 [Radiomyces spectabilis]|uniref:uncharacterized protein n=1 Tax=Radiomyces spectabilis TaxID=64574 RepID=UPI00221F4E36|nr:uncharacterized protein BYT42DRAFT_341036 [Radiomyces spectabilis]KAI8379796.1 hypothetical protein BYT42DRAFT_341036 [Radiomyces spectabilis]
MYLPCRLLHSFVFLIFALLSVASVHAGSNTAASTAFIDTGVLVNGLGEYYENIVDQVMEITTEDIITAAPQAFTSIHKTHEVIGNVDQPSASLNFVHSLRAHLNLMRSNLLASIRPLVESDLPISVRQSNKNDNYNLPSARIAAVELTEDVFMMNQRLAIQLGLIINAEQAAPLIIQQSLPYSSKATVSRASDGQQRFYDSGHSSENQWLQEHQALDDWLRTWLEDIHQTLSIEFDDRIQDAIQFIMEDFLLDE